MPRSGFASALAVACVILGSSEWGGLGEFCRIHTGAASGNGGPHTHASPPTPTPAAAARSLHEAAPETTTTSSSIPPFDWGVATAAYQVEGAPKEGGRGASIWDTFSKGAGDTAIDFYHKYKEDIALMQSKGVKKFRMSISWPRIQPSGTGAANKEGLAFYKKVFDALDAAGIEPWVTL